MTSGAVDARDAGGGGGGDEVGTGGGLAGLEPSNTGELGAGVAVVALRASILTDLSRDTLTLLAGTVLTAGMWELLAVGPHTLPVTHSPLVPHLLADLNCYHYYHYHHHHHHHHNSSGVCVIYFLEEKYAKPNPPHKESDVRPVLGMMSCYRKFRKKTKPKTKRYKPPLLCINKTV